MTTAERPHGNSHLHLVEEGGDSEPRLTEREWTIRNQHLFLEELEEMGMDISFYRDHIESSKRTFEETITSYITVIETCNRPSEDLEDLKIILNRLKILSAAYWACKKLFKAPTKSAEGSLKKKQIQRDIIAAKDLGPEAESILQRAVEECSPHLEGLDPEVNELPSAPTNMIISIKRAKSYKK